MGFAVPILTWHSQNIAGNDYAGNDHVAFASDLAQLHRAGYRFASLPRVVAALTGGEPLGPGRWVGLSLDDGTDFDWRDLDHPTCGPQRSMFGIVSDFLATRGDVSIHVTSFVVVSPRAREEIDRHSLVGRGWWTEDWWPLAVASGRWGIANHSWDHNDPAVSDPVDGALPRGSFAGVADPAAADALIARAAAHLRRRAPNAADSLFAYPFGQAPDYLVREYLPREGARIGVRAAFTGDGRPVTEASNRWALPRYVCGFHWKSPDDLAALLRDAASRPDA